MQAIFCAFIRSVRCPSAMSRRQRWAAIDAVSIRGYFGAYKQHLSCWWVEPLCTLVIGCTGWITFHSPEAGPRKNLVNIYQSRHAYSLRPTASAAAAETTTTRVARDSRGKSTKLTGALKPLDRDFNGGCLRSCATCVWQTNCPHQSLSVVESYN